MLSQEITDYLEQGIGAYLAAEGLTAEKAAVQLEKPPGLEHGDYSTSVAMRLAKALKQPPLKIAAKIKETIETSGLAHPLVSKLEVASPGYLNVFVDWDSWMQSMDSGGAPAKVAFSNGRRQKIVVEHTSINPNKSAHIGHLRNACIGDTLVRMLRRSGAQVEVHNYIDDLGNQLADTLFGLLHTPVSGDYGRFGDFCWDVYSGLHKQFAGQPQLQEQRAQVLHELEEGTGNTAWLGMITAERIVREHLEEMRQFGIHYDLLVWESSIVREGFWSAAFAQLQQTPALYLEPEGKLAGCWVLREAEDDSGAMPQEEEKNASSPATAAEEEELHSRDKVLVRSNGILTYTAKDIAYHLWKFGLLHTGFSYVPFAEEIWTTASKGAAKSFGGADRVINVIDRRQEYPQAMVKKALQLLGYAKQAENLQHVGYGVVSLSKTSAGELGVDTSDGKSSYAMSGRQGIGMKISDLLDRMELNIAAINPESADRDGLPGRQIAAAAIRYYLLRFSLQTEVVFDIKQATEITGNTGIYLMYTYSRSVSVLGKGGYGPLQQLPCGRLQQPPVPDRLLDLEPSEYALLRHIAAWPEALAAACRSLEPHLLCSYAYELCSLFNNFYAACPVIKAEANVKAFRFWLVSRFNETLGAALETLGLPAPSRM